MKPGPQNSITDIDGLKVGNAQDNKIKTGVTVLVPDAPLTASVHVMGGAPGTRETDLLAPDKTVDQIHALVLSGGSAFGLILFDLLNGGDKDWSVNPYRTLGTLAYENASSKTELGNIGAGTGATAGQLKGGLGTASLRDKRRIRKPRLRPTPQYRRYIRQQTQRDGKYHHRHCRHQRRPQQIPMPSHGRGRS